MSDFETIHFQFFQEREMGVPALRSSVKFLEGRPTARDQTRKLSIPDLHTNPNCFLQLIIRMLWFGNKVPYKHVMGDTVCG